MTIYHSCVKSGQCQYMINLMKYFLFQLMFNDASRVLYDALEEKVFFKEVIVVVPRTWRDSRCQIQIQTPRGALVYRVRKP